MKLKNVELIVGTCISNDDPNKLGRIKVGAPGYFDRTKMAIDDIPWVYPFTMSSNNSYTTIAEGQKVWLIDNKDNEEEFWYVPYHEMNPDTKEALNDDIESDVLFSRQVGDKLAQIYYNNTEGMMLRVGDAFITIDKQGFIRLQTSQANVIVEGSQVYCGTIEGEKEEMVRGQKCKAMIAQMSSDIKEVAKTALEHYPTSPLSLPLNNMAKNIDKALEKLLTSTAYTITKE